MTSANAGAANLSAGRPGRGQQMVAKRRRSIKILVGLYYAQMFLGLAAGFTLPWLRYWGFF